MILLGILGAIGAFILYFISRKFQIDENPNIELTEKVLPAANCGGCGFPGCRGFAEAYANADVPEVLSCPVGGAEVMAKVAEISGREAQPIIPMTAVVCCGGSDDRCPRGNRYDGALSCAVASALYGGETGCEYGCLGFGDCVKACIFDAIYINPKTLLPEVVEDACTACGVCVKACPKSIIELRQKGPKSRRIFVSCVNKDKGSVAEKACSVACIACEKCRKVCAFDAITIENKLAYIDWNKCTLCCKCVSECPTKSIIEVNFVNR